MNSQRGGNCADQIHPDVSERWAPSGSTSTTRRARSSRPTWCRACGTTAGGWSGSASSGIWASRRPRRPICMDARRSDGPSWAPPRAIIATLAFAGLRVGGAPSTRLPGDLSVERKLLRIKDAKTEAGIRTLDLRPALLDRSPPTDRHARRPGSTLQRSDPNRKPSRPKRGRPRRSHYNPSGLRPGHGPPRPRPAPGRPMTSATADLVGRKS